MATILVYNHVTGRMESYNRTDSEAMPYNVNRTLTVKEFRGSSSTTVMWTDRRFMQTWNAFRQYYGRPIYVGFAFRRIWEAGHGITSQHYAGGAFDIGQNLNSAGRTQLHRSAVNFGGWSYVEPLYETPTWVHVDARLGPPSCAYVRYPVLRQGSRGVYVLILQDALNALGFTGGGLDGYFGSGTRSAVIAAQRFYGLTPDGIVGCNSWSAIASNAHGIGRTPTVLRP